MEDRLLGWVISIPPYLVVAVGLAQMTLFSRRLQNQRVFSRVAALALRRFGYSLMIGAALTPLSRLCLTLYQPHILALTRPLFPGVVPPGLLVATALGVTFGLIFVLFASVLDEATRVVEENAGFI